MMLRRENNKRIISFSGFNFLPWVYKLNSEFVEDINTSLEFTKGGCVRYIGNEVKYWLNTTEYIRFPRPNGSRTDFQKFYSELHFYIYGRGLSYEVEMKCQDPKCINPEHFRRLEDKDSWVYNYVESKELGFRAVDKWYEYVAESQFENRTIVLKSKSGLCTLLKISPKLFDRYCRTGRIWKGMYKFAVIENDRDLTGDFDYGKSIT
jgi:hypothetical protein